MNTEEGSSAWSKRYSTILIVWLHPSYNRDIQFVRFFVTEEHARDWSLEHFPTELATIYKSNAEVYVK